MREFVKNANGAPFREPKMLHSRMTQLCHVEWDEPIRPSEAASKCPMALALRRSKLERDRSRRPRHVPIGLHRHQGGVRTTVVTARSDRVAFLCHSATAPACNPRRSRAAHPAPASASRRSNLARAALRTPFRSQAESMHCLSNDRVE